MATIIEELVVRLGLDSKDLVGKSSEAKKKLDDLDDGAKDVAKSTKSAAGGLSEVTGKLAGFLALVGGTVAIRSFVRDVVDTNTQLGFLARNLGTTAQALFAWGGAMQEIGGNKATIQNFARTVAEMPGQLLMGQTPQLLPLFARLGISFREPFEQIMLDLSKRFATMPKTMAFSFGLANGIPEDVMNLLLQGPSAVSLSLSRTGPFAPTQEEVATAKAMKQQLADIAMQFERISYDILEKASPYLEKFFAVIRTFATWVQEHEKLAAIFTATALGLAGLASAAVVIGGIVSAIGALGAALAVLANPISLAVGAITAAAVALGLIAKSTLSSALADHNYGPGKLLGRTGDLERLLFGIETQEGFFKAGSAPQRANNPGSILWDGPGGFAAQHGATGGMSAAEGKLLAFFPDVQTGEAAALALLKSQDYQRLTVAEIINRWTTGGKAPTPAGYLAGVLKTSHLAPNSVPSEVPEPIGATSTPPQQTGPLGLWQMITMSGVPNSQPVQGKTIHNTIGPVQVHIHTQATDGKGIAAEFSRGLHWLLASEFNTGLQ